MRDNRATTTTGFVETYRGEVEAVECSALGRMNIAFYFERFADAAASLLLRLAPSRQFRTVGLLVHYRKELRAGEAIAIRSIILGTIEDAKRERQVRLGHELLKSDGTVAAMAEHALAPRDTKMRSGLKSTIEAAVGSWTAEPFAPIKLPAAQGVLASLRDRIKNWELDEIGRLSLVGHGRRFSIASTQLMSAVGITATYIQQETCGMTPVETRLALAPWQPGAGGEVAVTSGFLAVGRSSVTMIHDLIEVKGGERIARFYQVSVHYDLVRRRSTPIPETMREQAARLTVKI